jgi:hypothetical protein
MNIRFRLECLNEDVCPEDDLEEENAKIVRAKINAGNDWAWFCAKVTAELVDPSTSAVVAAGTDYLGCCSYDSEEDFRACPYFESMKTEALKDLRSDVERLTQRLARARELLALEPAQEPG